MTRGDSVGNQRTTAPWSHKCWAVPKNDHPRWYGIWLLIPGQDSQFLKCQEKNMFLFHLLLGKTGSWNYGTSLSRILDLELSPSFFAWYHIMVRYWFVVSQLIIFKNSAHNGNFAHYQSVKKKKAIEKCLENEIYLESIQKSLGIYSTFIHWRQILYLDI